MAQVRIPAFDLRMLGETRLDEAQRAIGFLHARAIRSIDPDDELRYICAGKQAETNEGDCRSDDQKQAQRREQRGLRPGKRPAQRRPVDVVNDLHHPLQQFIGKHVEVPDQSRHFSGGSRRSRRVVAQHPACQKRNDRQCDEQRGQHSKQNGRRQRPDELAGAFGQEQQRQKCQHQRGRAA